MSDEKLEPGGVSACTGSQRLTASAASRDGASEDTLTGDKKSSAREASKDFEHAIPFNKNETR